VCYLTQFVAVAVAILGVIALAAGTGFRASTAPSGSASGSPRTGSVGPVLAGAPGSDNAAIEDRGHSESTQPWAIVTLGLWHMTNLTAIASFQWFEWSRVWQTVGLPFLFIPITTASYVGLPSNKSMRPLH
jgi:hypothetical protein